MKNNDDISEEYLLLFNTITDTEKELSEMSKKLIIAQQKAEEMYILAGAEHHYNVANFPALPRVDVKSLLKKSRNHKKLNVQRFICNHCQQRNACHS